MGIEETYLNTIKAKYDTPRANIILNAEKQSILPKIRKKTKMPTLATAIQHSIGSPSHGNQRTKRNNRHPFWKEAKRSLFADDIYYTKKII